MKAEMTFSWLIEAEVEGRECAPGASDEVVFNEVGGGNRQVKIRYSETGQMLFNGQFVDIGDDFMLIVAMVDEVMESATGAILFKTDLTTEVIKSYR